MNRNPVVMEAIAAAENLRNFGDYLDDKDFRAIAKKAAMPLIQEAKDNVPYDSPYIRRNKKSRQMVGALHDSIGVIPLRRTGPYIYVGPNLRGRDRRWKPWHAGIIEYGSKYYEGAAYMRRAYDVTRDLVAGMIKTSLTREYKRALGRSQYRESRDRMSWRFENGQWKKGGR